jgi:hypothetical protein
MTELATKTKTAASTIGIQSEVRPTIVTSVDAGRHAQ